MNQKALIVVIVGLTALVLGSVAAYAWDASRDDLIAVGVRVGGVELGGLRASQARVKLESELVAPLSRPIRVVAGKQTHTLGQRRIGLHSDSDAMVAEALATSREGGLPGRVWRALTGGEVVRELSPRLTYSRRALRRFVAELAGKLDRPARNATVEPKAGGLTLVAQAAGQVLRRQTLLAEIATELDSQAGDRLVEAPMRTTKPKLTIGELAGQYPAYIVVDRASFVLRFYKRLKLAKNYKVSIGQIGHDTPTGLYHVQNKQVNPTWHVPHSKWAGKLAGKKIPGGRKDNPLKARWMGIFNGAGIHGTDAVGSLGQAASHGCVRMAIPDVIELYDQVPVGTPVFIA